MTSIYLVVRLKSQEFKGEIGNASSILKQNLKITYRMINNHNKIGKEQTISARKSKKFNSNIQTALRQRIPQESLPSIPLKRNKK